eukprot:1161325-Pelagomonas_calceolata.AAC.32
MLTSEHTEHEKYWHEALLRVTTRATFAKGGIGSSRPCGRRHHLQPPFAAVTQQQHPYGKLLLVPGH